MSDSTTFYTVSDSTFFPGTVALINSLRLTGHDEPIVVLDSGLTPAQQAELKGHATLSEVPGDLRANPYLLKPFPFRAGAEGTIVLIDSDMIVTGSLGEALELARGGQICVFSDHPVDQDRWFAEWEELFSLRAPLRRQTYVNAGFVALSIDAWPELLERWWTLARVIPPDSELGPDHPLRDRDQDALNALLMSELPEGAVTILPERGEVYADSFQRVKIDGDQGLDCTFEGHPVLILHHCLGPKVWQSGGWRRMGRWDAFGSLLPRVLFGARAPIRLSNRYLPWWLRSTTPRPIALTAITAGRRIDRLRRGILRRARS